MRRFLLVLLAYNFWHASAYAANIDRIRIGALDLDIIVIYGPIVHGDAAVFSRLSSYSSRAIVQLNSEGGLVAEALAIGRVIRRQKFSTSVDPGHLCASACALIWLAGARRYAEVGSAIGFHASYIEKDGVMLESGIANALVGAYVSQLDLSDQVVAYVTSAPPKGMRWLTRDDAARLGLQFISAGTLLVREPASQKLSAGRTRTSYDPLGTVASFYKHLSVGDGNAATVLVVPEKRGAGPFNEEGISRFFGQMLEPLVVEHIRLVSENTINVRYRYRKNSSKSCIGNAKVQTIYRYGRTMIERIWADC